MNLLKKNLAFLPALVLCLCLAACGGNAPETLENIVLDDSIDYNLEDTYDEYLGGWCLEDNGSLWVSENNGTYFYELYDAYNEVISSGRLQYVKEYRCMYVYSEQEGIAHKCRIDHKLFGSEDDNMLYIDSFGTFSRASGEIEVIGNDWRTWGIVRDGGTITRDGEDTVVLVCVHKADATFYYDSEDQVLFDSVDYPIAFGGDVWDLYKGIDFADLNGDGDSDVTMRFDDGGSEIVLVWYWDTEEGYVYRAEESSTGGRKTTEEIYHELLERFYALVSDPHSYDTAGAGETGVLESARGLGEDALNGMGYLIEDLSGDGVPELVVGSLREYGGEINALYTLVDNETELVFEGWSRNSYTYVNAYVEDSSCFYNYGSNSAVESSQGVFTLSRNGREMDWQGFYFTYPEDENREKVAVYYNTTGSMDPADSEPADMTPEEYYELFSAPVAESMTDFWGMYCTESGLDLTPFSAFS